MTITAEAREQFNSLALAIKARVAAIFEGLEKWPAVSGVKHLKGQSRIRTGDYRVVFTVNAAGDEVTVVNIDNRRDVYK